MQLRRRAAFVVLAASAAAAALGAAVATAAPGPSPHAARPSAFGFFLSPSRNIGCSSGADDITFCWTKAPRRSAILQIDGRVMVCYWTNCAGAFPARGVPVLGHGRVNVVGPFRCSSAPNGITCTVTRGNGAGRGFRINRAGVTRVGR